LERPFSTPLIVHEHENSVDESGVGKQIASLRRCRPSDLLYLLHQIAYPDKPPHVEDRSEAEQPKEHCLRQKERPEKLMFP
jgi:hypothetical protein